MISAAIKCRRGQTYCALADLRSRYPLFSNLHTATTLGTMATKKVMYSEGEDVAQLQHSVESLLADGGGHWKLSASGKGLERQLQFKTFKKTWEFMDAVASKCAKERHHPEWSNVYNKVFVRWTTHKPSGLSSKDVLMAQFCDDIAASLGIVEETSPEKNLDGLLEPLVNS